jgi:hypothetical protein
MTRKLTARKHVRAPPCQNLMPTKSHSNGQLTGYFLGLCECYFSHWDMVRHCSSSKPLGCTGGLVWEVDNRSHLLYPPSDWSCCLELDVWRWNLWCCASSLGCAMPWGGWLDGAFPVLTLPEPSPWRSWCCGVAYQRSCRGLVPVVPPHMELEGPRRGLLWLSPPSRRF